MSGHTPGPWHVNASGDVCAWFNDRLTFVATVNCAREEADARLIAAAPTLLAALEGMECGGCHLKITEYYERPCPACAPAFAAIAAARGLEVSP